MGQLQNQFQQMMGGQSPYSGGGQQQRQQMPYQQQNLGRGYAQQQRGNFGTPGYQQPQTRGSGGYSGQPQQQPPMQRGIDGMPGRGGMLPQPPIQTGGFKPEKGQPQLSGPPMMPPTQQNVAPGYGPPQGTGGFKPSREPVGAPVQAPPDGTPIDPVQAQASAAGQMQGGSVSPPLGQIPPNPQQAARRRGYQNPYKKQGGYGGGMQPDGGPEFMY